MISSDSIKLSISLGVAELVASAFLLSSSIAMISFLTTDALSNEIRAMSISLFLGMFPLGIYHLLGFLKTQETDEEQNSCDSE